ncbi:MAG: DUF2799 domain-containing protein, partial [Bdellovibrionales bacterium]|nr:DUF2799 domain-containing protein [Bdellovibrionales bacterium]
LFDIGRKAGLIDYCKPENAYELGKDGKSYTNVCPPETQTKFLEFFRKGHHVRELQEANQDIDKKVSILQEKIRELTPDNQKNLNTQISTLQNRKARNLRQVENIEKTIDL